MKFTLTIKKNGTFKYILNNGKFKSVKYISVHYNRNKIKVHPNYNFLGICISKKNGNSVCRNKMKRWVREVYKEEENKLKKGLNIVVLYKKTTKISDINFYIVKDEMIKCFRELDLYEKNI